MKLNEGESEEKSTVNEWQGHRCIRAQQSTALAELAEDQDGIEQKQKISKYSGIVCSLLWFRV